MEVQQYVCGFIFFQNVGLPAQVTMDIVESKPDNVLLILKDRPDWQAGMFNGIGGKVERGEYPRAAMMRECKEESGLYIDKWHNFARMEGPDFSIQFYSSFQQSIPQWQNLTSEKLFAFPVNCLPSNLISPYLIPLARDKRNDFGAFYTK